MPRNLSVHSQKRQLVRRSQLSHFGHVFVLDDTDRPRPSSHELFFATHLLTGDAFPCQATGRCLCVDTDLLSCIVSVYSEPQERGTECVVESATLNEHTRRGRKKSNRTHLTVHTIRNITKCSSWPMLENSNSYSKALFYKDCSLGSVKNLSNN